MDVIEIEGVAWDLLTLNAAAALGVSQTFQQ
jgi:hypothetical protein